jgi:hypothetical protein
MSIRMILPPALGSYANIFVPRAKKAGADGKPGKLQYSIALLWDRKQDLKALKEAIVKVAVEKFGPKAADIFGKNILRLKCPLHDGDVDKPENEAYAGKVYLNARSDRKPGVANRRGELVMEDSEAYSGCTFRVSVGIYAFDNESKGVGVGLNNLQVIEKGPRLDNQMDAAAEFKEYTDGGTGPDTSDID